MDKRNKIIQKAITILQVIVFISTMYCIISWHFKQWEGKDSDPPIESLAIGSLIISIYIVSLIDRLRNYFY